jgi:uncharacterized membrane protein
MAGIGFELRNILRERSISSLLSAYGYSTVISAGPWIVSIISILFVGLLSLPGLPDKAAITEFQVSVTYTFALSLIYTGALLFLFTRFLSDRLFEKDANAVLPNTMGALLLVMGSGFALFLLLGALLFGDASRFYRFLLASSFALLCGIWVLAVLLSSLKNYKTIFWSFVAAFAAIIALSYPLSFFGIEGLMFDFMSGQALLFLLLLGTIIQHYPSDRLFAFGFFKRRKVFVSLVFSGLFFNLGVWIDEFVFWFSPGVSQHVIGAFRSSLLYDLPVFLSYISIAPGMAMFLLRLETDFAKKYDDYYNAVREGETLERIYIHGNRLSDSARTSLFEIVRFQTIITLIIYIFSEPIFDLIGFPKIFLPLFHIDLVGAELQLLLMSELALFFYLDKRKSVLILTFLFVLLNGSLSQLTVWMGAYYFGYGFAGSLLIVSTVGLLMLSKDLKRLHYETFMLQ